jgi:hypothetical protein
MAQSTLCNNEPSRKHPLFCILESDRQKISFLIHITEAYLRCAFAHIIKYNNPIYLTPTWFELKSAEHVLSAFSRCPLSSYYAHPALTLQSSSLGTGQMGVFATSHLPKNTIVCVYLDSAMSDVTKNPNSLICKFNDADFPYPTTAISDWSLESLKDSFDKYANGTGPHHRKHCNLDWFHHSSYSPNQASNGLSILKTNRDIAAGEELFKYYGTQIWLQSLLGELALGVPISDFGKQVAKIKADNLQSEFIEHYESVLPIAEAFVEWCCTKLNVEIASNLNIFDKQRRKQLLASVAKL